MKFAKTTWNFILAANWLIILFFWWQGSGAELGLSLANTLIAIGRLSGLAAVYSIWQQFFFMGRNPLLERVYGLDKLSAFHRLNGKLAIVFILFHPVLLVWGYSRLADLNVWAEFLLLLKLSPLLILAFIALLLFLLTVGTSLYIVRHRLPYETWYYVHLFNYAALALVVWHQFAIGSDLLASRLFYGYWLGMYLLIFGSHFIFRFIRPFYLLRRFQFRVDHLVKETPAVTSVYITGQNLAKFKIKAGQFLLLRFLAKGYWWQEHPFSLSCAPNGSYLRLSIKASGDFTKTISQLPVGTKILIDGPYGVFTEKPDTRPKVLLIAGGIGITPLRSLAEQMLQHGKDILLLYANRNAQEIALKNELEQLSKSGSLKLVHILSDEPSYQGETGYLDFDKLKRLAPDLLEREVFLCGPGPMMDKIRRDLKNLGLPRQVLHYERFSL